MTDYDGPWKEALDFYFPAFLALFLPAMNEEIDWPRGYELLDKELQQVAPDAELGRRFVDKLVKVWRTTGEEEWVLIHVEVQSQEQSQFAQRMFVYNCRLAERYNKSVVSVAVLTDENPAWRPQRFHRELWGCSTEFRFPVVKLLDYAARAEELADSENSFAWFVLAHLKALETRRDSDTRYTWKTRITRNLFEHGLTADDVRRLFRFVDWLIDLPVQLAVQYREFVDAIQKEKGMPYITSIERLAKEEGLEEGREEGLEEGLEKGNVRGLKRGIRAVLLSRFGEAGLLLMPEIEAFENSNLLDTILDRATSAATPDEIRQCWK